MTTLPTFERFAELASNHDLVPVYRRFLSDSLTPVTAFQMLYDGQSAACLFESVIGGEKVGRYSFIATGRAGRLTAYGLELRTEIEGKVVTAKVADPLDSLLECGDRQTRR